MSIATVRGLLLFTFAAITAVPTARAELPTLQPFQTLEPQPEEAFPPDGSIQTPFFAKSLALDGAILLAGMPGAADEAGRVAAFARDATGTWARAQTLEASDAVPGARFGTHVALANGRALVASRTGVYVFVSSGGAWHQTQQLEFGEPVQIADLAWNGSVALVGAGINDLGARSNGVHAFRLTGSGRLERIGEFTASDTGPNDLFGNRVAMAGAAVAITAPGYNSDQGAAYFFTCTLSGCRERRKLLASDGKPGDDFGSSVDLRRGVIVIGAPSADPTSQKEDGATGAAYVFVRRSREWIETQKLGATAEESSPYRALGSEIAVTAKRVLVSALGIPGFTNGMVFIYDWSEGSLVATHVLVGTAGYGESLALAGRKAIVGIPVDSAIPIGHADVYHLPADIP